ncbi:MAG: UbiD family decarboxylase [Sulfobacillus benefaciens]|uniref:UbiD family decarboxylase n=1 Tax=Sulfobacillus benefaciens TaxID=453960 RepID=A0A2T2XCK0_9FIRM|nr:MAG: UbiD family decarboxylase [Sulfobacillus benefaciens]
MLMITVFRDLVQDWEDRHWLRRIRREVSPRYEVAAVAKKFKGRQPLLFDHVQGIGRPVVIGMGGDRTLMAESMGISSDDLIAHLMQAIVHPIATQRVAQAPVQETIVYPPFDVGHVVPGLIYHGRDSGPYYVAGVMVVKSPDGTKQYTSVRRMQILPGNRINVVITSPELFRQFRSFEEAGRPMEIAVMFGVVPAVILSSQLATHLFHVDKLSVAGGLLGQALPTVHCKTVDLDVLADAECVLEGVMLPGVRELEGPFGELGGYYSQRGLHPVAEIRAVTHRRDFMIHTVMPASYEERLPMVLNREVVLLQTVRQVVPNVTGVHITMGGVGRFHAVIAVAKENPGDGTEAALAAFASDKDLKHVVVVNDDIDIFDPEDVEWAIATRVQADQDLFIVPGAKGSPLEASHHLHQTTAKVGIDATYPLDQADLFQRTSVPGEANLNLSDYL